MTCGMMTCEMNNLDSEVCVQPWFNPLCLTGLKAPTNKLTDYPCQNLRGAKAGANYI